MPTIPPPVVAFTRPVQPAVDAITFAVEFRSADVIAMRGGNRGTLIVACFDRIAATVQTVLNAITMIGSSGQTSTRQSCHQDE